MLASRVDDILWAAGPSAEHAIGAIQKELKFGALDEGTFRFCGVWIVQEPDYTVRFPGAQTFKLSRIPIASDRTATAESPATREEQEALRSCTGGLMWISRSCRPGVSYDTSTLQTAVNKLVIADLLRANKVVQRVIETAQRGLVYKPGLRWPTLGDGRTYSRHSEEGDAPSSSGHTRRGDASKSSEHADLPDICIIACSDASHGGEDEWLDEWQEHEPFRSQGAELIFIADAAILDGEEAQVHLELRQHDMQACCSHRR